MNTPTPPREVRHRTISLFAPALAALFLVTPPYARATNWYWDLNGTTAGSGANGMNAVWDYNSTANWSTGSTAANVNGTTSTTVFTGARTSADVFLSAGADSVGTYTISINNTHPTATSFGYRSMTVEEGSVTFVGGTAPSLYMGAGALTINAGASATFDSSLTLRVADHTSIANNSVSTLVIASGIVANAGRTLTLGGGGNTLVNGVMANGGGSANLAVVVNTTGTVTLTAANTYTSPTTLSAGTLSVATIGNGGVESNLGKATSVATNLVFDGGSLQYTGLTASTNRNFTINAGKTATFDITTNNLTLSGASTATTGGLRKTGNGTLTLSGANLYTGATTISAGTLALGASGSLASTSLAISNGATFDVSAFGGGGYTIASGSTLNNNGTVSGSLVVDGTLSGTGTISGATTISGILSPGNSPGSQTFENGLTLTSSSQTLLEIASTSLYDQLFVSNSLTYGGTLTVSLLDSFTLSAGETYDLFNFSGFDPSGAFSSITVAGTALLETAVGSGIFRSAETGGVYYTFTSGTGVLAAIPEPSTYAAIVGALALGAVVWRRRSSNAQAQA